MLFESNEIDFDIFNLNDFNFNQNNFNLEHDYHKLFSSKEGFLKGNMFIDEYKPYKGMNYVNIVPTCEREVLLYKIMEIDFAINDLNLYLDLKPEDCDAYDKFKVYVEECIRLKDEYAKKYGPLTMDEVVGKSYNWLNNPWPWEKTGGSMYV